jgi:hypothetical protein
MLIKNQIFLFLALNCCITTGFTTSNCPATDIVSDVNFLHAEGAEGIWDIYSQPFSYADKTWQVKFTVYLPEVSSASEALEFGADYYHSQVNFFTSPFAREQNNQITCYYAQEDEQYFVRAMTLPT